MGSIVISDNSNYPSLALVANLIRALLNDTQAGLTGTPGEGQIFTNNPQVAPFVQPLMNSAIREVYRELRNVGDPALIKDNILVTGIPVMASPTNGTGPDPAVQTQLSILGYYDGVQTQPQVSLPSDCLYLTKVWQRQNGSGLPFLEMNQAQFGIPSAIQTNYFGQWEWRDGALWLTGSLVPMDLRLRYYASFPSFFSANLDFESTLIPVPDCADAVAYKTAVKYFEMMGDDKLENMQASAKEQMFQLKNACTRRAQSVDYQRIEFGSTNSFGSSNGNQLI